jgi:hypothetical protein
MCIDIYVYMYATEHHSNMPLSIASSSGVNNDAHHAWGSRADESA